MFTKKSTEELYEYTAKSHNRRLPKRGDIYKHFKGDHITIIDLAIHTETEEPLVIYMHDGLTVVRPLNMFLEEVDKEKYPEEKQKYRFERVIPTSDLISNEFSNNYSKVKEELRYSGCKPDPGVLMETTLDRYYR